MNSPEKSGFTLVELLIALVILVIIVTSFARFAGDFSRSMGQASVRTIATGVATGRLELIRADPRYSRLTSLYGSGAGADTSGFSGYSDMRRVTTVVRDTSGSRDFTTVTVEVVHSAYHDTVAVTALIARP